MIDRSFWLPSGTGPSIDQTNGELQIDVPADSEPDSGGHAIVAGVMSRCVLHGDFDAQVDYRLLDWPEANGVHLDFGTNHPQAVGRQNMAGELIFAWFPPDVVNLPFGELGGSLRLVKRGETISGYVRAPGGWRRLTHRGRRVRRRAAPALDQRARRRVGARARRGGVRQLPDQRGPTHLPVTA